MSSEHLFGAEPQDTSFYNDPMMPAKQTYAEPAPLHSDLELEDPSRTYVTLQTPGSMRRQGEARGGSSTSSILDLSVARRDVDSPIPSPTEDGNFLASILSSSNLPLGAGFPSGEL